jgi:hypothetical protein
MADDEFAALSGLPPTLRLPAAMRLLEKELSQCFSPVAHRTP